MLDLENITSTVSICAVTKGRTVAEVESVLKQFPFIKVIGENRWPDCEEKFKHFHDLQKHFIGPLQTNKIRKVVKITDVIQSVDSFDLLQKVDRIASEENRKIKFCFQVNISHDPQKQGIEPDMLFEIIEDYLSANLQNVELVGLMTIGSQDSDEKRYEYFKEFKELFDKINAKYFSSSPLPVLSMGMSEDYQLAVKAGATMVRIGSALFAK